jgi:hypothetical protein
MGEDAGITDQGQASLLDLAAFVGRAQLFEGRLVARYISPVWSSWRSNLPVARDRRL